MVQVASLGLGKSGTGGHEVVSRSGDYFGDGFHLSQEIIIIFLIVMFLAILSIAGFFICHCFPSWLPEKFRDIRAHIYRTNGKIKKFPLKDQFSDEQYLFLNDSFRQATMSKPIREPISVSTVPTSTTAKTAVSTVEDTFNNLTSGDEPINNGHRPAVQQHHHHYHYHQFGPNLA